MADGFYEWRKDGKGKVPLWIYLKNQERFCFAGLWNRRKKPDGGDLDSFTIITTEPIEFMASIYNRMPVILSPEAERTWLDPELKHIEKLCTLLEPYPAYEMATHYVSKLLNFPTNDNPRCLIPTGDYEIGEDPGKTRSGNVPKLGGDH